VKKIAVTKYAYAALGAGMSTALRETSTERADGMMSVLINDDTFGRLRAIRQPGESMSDTLLRLVAYYREQRLLDAAGGEQRVADLRTSWSS
jgi:hypothetical protein